MRSDTILLVEDDERLRSTIEDYLTISEFRVLTAGDGVEAVEIFKESHTEIDIVVLDGMLPGMDGFEVLKIIRSISKIPVIMLSARESEEDQLTGFELGANIYMTKPFLMSVLKAQIQAILGTIEKYEVVKKGALLADTGSRRFYLDGELIETTPKEYEVLLYLMRNENIVLDRNTILDNVWGHDYFGNDRTVDTIIKQLRKKLTPDHPYIKSVYGVGYRFEVAEDD